MTESEAAMGRRASDGGSMIGGSDAGEASTVLSPHDVSLPRVLVIDDEQLLGQTIQLGLEDSMNVELELSGARGLERVLSDDGLALVLCDLSLPDLSGVQIYERLVKERPDLKKRFVVMTGGAVSVESRVFLENYKGPLLNKPFTLREVEKLVQNLLDD